MAERQKAYTVIIAALWLGYVDMWSLVIASW